MCYHDMTLPDKTYAIIVGNPAKKYTAPSDNSNDGADFWHSEAIFLREKKWETEKEREER